jgi:RNA polymerase subunit RPABC4/transcription elongation factor Spt4
MVTCPKCHETLREQTAFCPHCGTQLKVQPVAGEVVDLRRKSSLNASIKPATAARLSIIPGLGHWYARSPLRGLAFFAAIVGPLVVGTELDLSVIGAVVGVPLDMGGLALWGYCAFDAYRTAKKRINLVT